MSRITFVLLVVVGVLLGTGIAQGQQKCSDNQEWTTCGSACPPTCNAQDPAQPCTLQCIIGCQCRSGYLLNSAGNCVSPQNC